MSSGKPVLWDQGAEKDASSSSLDDSNTVMTNAEKEKRWKKKPAKVRANAISRFDELQPQLLFCQPGYILF